MMSYIISRSSVGKPRRLARGKGGAESSLFEAEVDDLARGAAEASFFEAEFPIFVCSADGLMRDGGWVKLLAAFSWCSVEPFLLFVK